MSKRLTKKEKVYIKKWITTSLILLLIALLLTNTVGLALSIQNHIKFDRKMQALYLHTSREENSKMICLNAKEKEIEKLRKELESYKRKDTEVLKRYSGIPISDELKLFINDVTNYYELNTDMVMKVIFYESHFNESAGKVDNNGVGYLGLMQVSYQLKETYHRDDYYEQYLDNSINLYDLYQNVIVGCRVLVEKQQSQWCESTDDMLNLYNGSYPRTDYSDYINWLTIEYINDYFK